MTPEIWQSENNADVSTVRRYTEKREALLGHRPYVCIRTFGCQQNEADSERLCGMAEAMGYEKTDNPADADLIVYNTCAVREHAELKALSLAGQLKHLKNGNPDQILCLCGCMTAQEHRLGDIKNKYPYIDLLFGATSLHKFPSYLAAVIRKREDEHERKKRLFYPDTDALIAEGLPVHRESRTQAWVSIMYGCNNFCTYCVVPYVRGRERSRLKEYILAEVKELIENGYKEITLLGQNVNSYGKDLYHGSYDFADLLTEICAIQGDVWIRFMTSHPKDASDKLIDTIASHAGGDGYPRIARHFHLPLQSGSDRILSEMNRRYTSDDYLRVAEKLKERVPGIALTTDIIVGFPGETEEDFEGTLSMLKKVSFDNIYAFQYSPRKGTPAALMTPCTEEEKNDRFARLMACQGEISLARNTGLVGETVRVLVEGPSKSDPSLLTGRNEQNRLVHFAGDPACIGTFVNVRVTEADLYSLKGELS